MLGLILGCLPFNFLGNALEARRYLRAAGADAPPASVLSPASSATPAAA